MNVNPLLVADRPLRQVECRGDLAAWCGMPLHVVRPCVPRCAFVGAHMRAVSTSSLPCRARQSATMSYTGRSARVRSVAREGMQARESVGCRQPGSDSLYGNRRQEKSGDGRRAWRCCTPGSGVGSPGRSARTVRSCAPQPRELAGGAFAGAVEHHEHQYIAHPGAAGSASGSSISKIRRPVAWAVPPPTAARMRAALSCSRQRNRSRG